MYRKMSRTMPTRRPNSLFAMSARSWVYLVACCSEAEAQARLSQSLFVERVLSFVDAEC